MPGTSSGARKAAVTNKERDKDHYQKVGGKGGKKKVPKGMSFATPEMRRQWGRKGGMTLRVKRQDPTE